MNGSKLVSDRINLIQKLDKIIFNSDWSKNRFIKNLDNIYCKSPKLKVIKQSIDPKKINFKKKKK